MLVARRRASRGVYPRRAIADFTGRRGVLWPTAALLLAIPASHASGPGPFTAAFIAANAFVAYKGITGTAPTASGHDYLAAGIGKWDAGQRKDSTAVYSAEYRFGSRQYWNGQPLIGVGVTGHQSVYGYGGLRFSVPLARGWEVATDIALAAYGKGNGKDLGSAAEAYFALSAVYRLPSDVRIEVALRHMSHGHFFSTEDPGSDMLGLTVAFPFR